MQQPDGEDWAVSYDIVVGIASLRVSVMDYQTAVTSLFPLTFMLPLPFPLHISSTCTFYYSHVNPRLHIPIPSETDGSCDLERRPVALAKP
jgi:hypothetical protein